MPLRLIFMGTPDFAVPTLLALAGHGHDIAAVYTRAPKPAGRRGLELTPSPIEREARRLGLGVHTPASLRAADVQMAFAWATSRDSSQSFRLFRSQVIVFAICTVAFCRVVSGSNLGGLPDTDLFRGDKSPEGIEIIRGLGSLLLRGDVSSPRNCSSAALGVAG